jgi:hypothetical protein
MKIDERLYLSLPVDRNDGTTVWIHAAPVGREIFERYWLTMSKTFAMIWGEGLNTISGPLIAALALRRCAEDAKEWEGPTGVALGLLPEIRRLANVVAPGKAGWDIVPLDQAKTIGMIDEEDVTEVEGVLVFFTVCWHLNLRSERRGIMNSVAARLDASMSSQTLSAFVGSLKISTATGSTGGSPPGASSPPSSTGPQGPASSSASTSVLATFPGARLMNSGSDT